MGKALDPRDMPPRQFSSMRELRLNHFYRGLNHIPDLAAHMTRRGVVGGLLAGLSGFTIACKVPSDSGRDSAAGVDSGRDSAADTGLGETGLGDTGEAGDTGAPEVEAPGYDLGVWINVAEDEIVTIVMVKNEMGQGIATALAMAAADELDVPWENVRVRLEAEMNEYDLPGWSDGTWGSTSVMENYEELREIGAAAREMILAAAAARWGVDSSELRTSAGRVVHDTHGELTYGALAEEASAQALPTRVTLKDPADFTIIGTDARRVDIDEHTRGETIYGIDVAVDGMRYAAVRQAPAFGGEPLNFDALSIDGTGALALVLIPNGIAVVADSWWLAKKTVEALDVEFDVPPQLDGLSSADMEAQFNARLDGSLSTGSSSGNADAAMGGAAATIEADYYAPMLTHLCMEPMNCTAHVTKDGCEIWVPTQYAKGVRSAASSILGLPESQITVHATALGGGFGRKAETDYATQAVMIAQAFGGPVKVIWSRTETVQHGYYRPPVAGRIQAGISKDGTIEAWIGKAAGCGIYSSTSTWNLSGFDLTYDVRNYRLEWAGFDWGIPFGYLRAPGYNKFTFMIETHVDMLAEAIGADAAEVRLKNLEANPRAYAVLEAALEAADWGNPTNPDAAHGCAVLQYGSDAYIALVAEVSVDASMTVNVHRVWSAVDIGVVVNPDIVRAQIEGSVLYSLSTGLFGEVTMNHGAVEQSNFHDFDLFTIDRSPEFETVIIDSDEEPGGVGEHAIGPILPAVTNALYKLTGTRITQLPISRYGFK